VLNAVTYKKAIKMLLIHTAPTFLDTYNFKSTALLKSILDIEDF
jgi:hypothetical protein